MSSRHFGFSYKSDAIFRPDEPSAGGAVSMHGQGERKSREGKVTLQIVRNGNKIHFKRIPEKGNEEVDFMITMNNANATTNNDFNAFKKGMQEMCINQVVDYIGMDKAIACLIQASESKTDILNYLKSNFETETVLDILMKKAANPETEKVNEREFINRIFNNQNANCVFHSSNKDAKILDSIIEDIPSLQKGKGRYGITCRKFFETLLDTIDPEGKLVKHALQILVDGMYHTSYGITLEKALPVVSVLVYHSDHMIDVAAELDKYVKEHDFHTLKVDANREIEFLDKLDIRSKMALYLEQIVCKNLSIPTEMVRRNN